MHLSYLVHNISHLVCITAMTHAISTQVQSWEQTDWIYGSWSCLSCRIKYLWCRNFHLFNYCRECGFLATSALTIIKWLVLGLSLQEGLCSCFSHKIITYWVEYCRCRSLMVWTYITYACCLLPFALFCSTYYQKLWGQSWIQSNTVIIHVHCLHSLSPLVTSCRF